MITKLIVASGKSAGRTISLKNGRLLIGRAETCDVRPLGEEVSRKHCEIVLEADGLTVVDCGSRNGTFVNGAKIAAKVTVKDGDIIRVGPLEVKVSVSKPEAPAAPAAMDDVSRWLMADDEPAGIFDTTQTVRTGDSPAQPIPVPADAAATPGGVPAAPEQGSAPVAAGPADDSAVRAADSSSTSIKALLEARSRPGTLPADAKKAKSDSSRDAAADALRKFFGKR
jgi:predicted component of type VI protein secretion system